MNSTPTPKAIEPRDGLIVPADERLAHAYEQILRADSLQKWSAMTRAHLRLGLARNHRLIGRKSIAVIVNERHEEQCCLRLDHAP